MTFDSETLDNKRLRLRRELQEAYAAWLRTSEFFAGRRAVDGGVDVTGCCDSAKADWFEYLAAKDRLALAYAEPIAA